MSLFSPILSAIVWAVVITTVIFILPGTSIDKAIRHYVEPLACTIFPVNLLWFPLGYWLFMLTVSQLTVAKRRRDGQNVSFRNAFITWHPLAGKLVLVAAYLEFLCLYPSNQ